MLTLPKILTPVDFSDRSATSGRYARALACHFHSELTLLHVMEIPPFAYAGLDGGNLAYTSMIECLAPARRTLLDNFLAGELRNIQVKRVLRSGEPAQEIVSWAHEDGSSLIVMPTHGYGPFRRFVLGSVTAKVLHDADCPVFTGVHMPEQPGLESLSFRNIVCAIDLGPQSGKAVRWAWQFAGEFRARLTIVHVTPCLEPRAGEYFNPNWRGIQEAGAREDVAALQKTAGTDADVVVEDASDSAKAVCAATDRLGADLLVIGRSADTGLFGRLRADAYAIIRESPCPVVSV